MRPSNEPLPGSVWDYPRPPRVEHERRRAVVEFGGVTIAESTRAVRVLETSHPPTIYIPQADISPGVLKANRRQTVCEWKGAARYWDIRVGDRIAAAAAWDYPDPRPGYEALGGHVSFYPQLMDRCTLGGEIVVPQPGAFYGGWITSDVAGPFKGAPGPLGW